MKRKSTEKPDVDTKPAQGEKDQFNIETSSQDNDISAKKSFFIKFGIDRVIYSIAAVLIFLSGIYFGLRYLPAVQEDSYSISYNKDPLIKKDRNLFKRSTTSLFSEPEDFFPAAEFRKQAAILIGCQNNLNKSSQL